MRTRPGKISKANDLDAFEHSVLNSATYWNAFVRVSPFDRRSGGGPSFADAIREGHALMAETKRSVLIYAVTDEGRSIMAGTLRLNGQFVSAVHGWEPPAA